MSSSYSLFYSSSFGFVGPQGLGAVNHGGACSLQHQQGTQATGSKGEPVAFNTSLSELLKAAPLFFFSMNASVIYLPVRKEHRARQASKGVGAGTNCHLLIFAAVAVAALFYYSCAAAAYFAYCSSVPENVVDVWPNEKWVFGTLARGLLAAELVMAGAGIYVPLARAALWHLRFGFDADGAPSGLARILVTLLILLAGASGSVALGGALALPLGITSALCVTAQMFVLPGLCAYRAAHKMALLQWFSLSFALFGLGFGILSLAALLGLLG